MICPKCQKPYLFITEKSKRLSSCLKCGHSEIFNQPNYLDYHDNLYLKKSYTRNIATDPQMKFIIQKLGILPTDILLDIGCGVGDYTHELHNIAPNTIGLDLNTKSARNKYPKIQFMDFDCNNPLPIPNSSMDKIISINLIEHLSDYTNFLKECYRVIKPGGKIAITTANLDFFLHDYFFDRTHVHEWTIERFKKIMNEYFETEIIIKSSSMFKYHPYNRLLTLFLKPDILFIGTKK